MESDQEFAVIERCMKNKFYNMIGCLIMSNFTRETVGKKNKFGALNFHLIVCLSVTQIH